jgi:ketosteroid isomerase-like protein
VIPRLQRRGSSSGRELPSRTHAPPATTSCTYSTTSRVNGAVGAVARRDGRPFSVGAVTVREGKIVELDFLTDPERLTQLDLTVLDR